MTFTINGRDLALVLGAGLLGLLAAQSMGSAQADEPTTSAPSCKQHEVTIWMTTQDNEGCDLKPHQAPFAHNNQWCSAPTGVEIIGLASNSSGTGLWIKRCKQ